MPSIEDEIAKINQELDQTNDPEKIEELTAALAALEEARANEPVESEDMAM